VVNYDSISKIVLLIFLAHDLFLEELIHVIVFFEHHEDGFVFIVCDYCFDVQLELIINAVLRQLPFQSLQIDQV